MKKITKILLLVLSLSLICGIIAVAAFAETETAITGIRVDNSGDFENMTVTEIKTGSGQVITNLDSDNNAAKYVTFKYQGSGEGKIVTNPVDNNTYITVDFAGTTGSTHYIQTYTKPNGWGTYTADTNEYYNEIKYYVADFDVAWFDVANYNGAGSFNPYAVYTNAAGSGRVAVDGNFGITFSKADGKVVAKFKGGDGTGYEVGNEKWSHVTWIMEPIIITDDAGENIKIKQYLAIDGIVVGVHEWTSTTAASTVYDGDRTRIYSLDIRFNPFGSAGAAGCTDNFNFRTFLPEYNGNLADVLAGGVDADLTTFESNLYDAAKMPAALPEASVGEGDAKTYYATLEEAIAAAAGATVTLERSVSGIEVNEPVVIACGDYTITGAKVGGGLVGGYDAETKTWAAKDASEFDITYTTADGLAGLTASADAFLTALNNVADGGVITLYADAVYTPAANIKVLKDVTLNLNGHVLDMLTTYKGQYFQIGSGKTFTVLGEEEGSALIAGYSKGANAAGGTLFSSTGTNATITLKGKGLFVSCAALYGAWGNYHVTINIEDCYLNHNGATENSYNVYISSGSGNAAAFTLNIKNAVVKGLTAGVYSEKTTVQSTVNIENSVILSQILTASSSTTNINAVVNVKGNSYINGSLNKATKVNVTGENNYFTTNDWVDKATFEEGVALMNATDATFEHVNYGHSWVVSGAGAEWDHAATIAVTAAPETKTYAYKAAVGITVNFYDGENLLGFAIGEPGMKVIGPAAGAAYPVADGWVMATKSYAYTIPANAKAAINVDIKDVTEFDYAYSKGAPSIYTNYDITDNLCNNLYVPTTLPEGIENFKVYLDKVEGNGRSLTPGYTINGQAYSVTSRWPGGTGADGAMLYIIKFTYEGVEFTFNADTNITGYAKKVYDIYKDDAEKVEQMTALLQYVDAANRLGGFTPTTAFTELYDEVKANYTVREVPVAEGNVDALSAYLGGAELYAGYNAGLMFEIKDTEVTFKIVGSNGTIDGIVGDKGVSAGYYGTGNYNFGIWAAAPFTIQVIDGEGEVIAEGEYSLAAYYNSVKATASEDELAVIQAIYVLGAIGNVNK